MSLQREVQMAAIEDPSVPPNFTVCEHGFHPSCKPLEINNATPDVRSVPSYGVLYLVNSTSVPGVSE